jgi:hypothetical protein
VVIRLRILLIIAKFVEIFPVKYKSKREQQLEVEDAKKELEIYRRILDKKS